MQRKRVRWKVTQIFLLMNFIAYEHVHYIYLEVSPKTVSNPVALLDPIMQLLQSDVSRNE